MIFELLITYPLDAQYEKRGLKALALAEGFGFSQTESFTYLPDRIRQQRFESCVDLDQPTLGLLKQQMRRAIPKLKGFTITRNDRPLNQATHWAVAQVKQGDQVIAIQVIRREPQESCNA